MEATKRVWKIRIVKPYAEAHNHVVIGEVLEDNPTWVRVRGRTFHYGRSAQRPQDVRVGPEAVRIIPWNRIEIINELQPEFDYSGAKLFANESGHVGLRHGRMVSWIITDRKDTH